MDIFSSQVIENGIAPDYIRFSLERGNSYSQTTKSIKLSDQCVYSPISMYHEYGHLVADRLGCPLTTIGAHTFYNTTSEAVALTEGWAEYYSIVRFYNNHLYSHPSLLLSVRESMVHQNDKYEIETIFDLSDGVCRSIDNNEINIARSEKCEGAVASMMYNLNDYSAIFNTMQTDRPGETCEFVESWPGDRSILNSVCRNFQIHCAGVDLIAGFSVSTTSGSAPLEVRFTDQSQGDPARWQWNFGDGGVSTEQNPAHTYASAGATRRSWTLGSWDWARACISAD